MVTLVPKMPKLEIFIIDPGTGPGGTPAQLRDFTVPSLRTSFSPWKNDNAPSRLPSRMSLA